MSSLVWFVGYSSLMFMCMIFQFLLLILDMLRSVLCVIDSGILFFLFVCFLIYEQLFSFKSINFLELLLCTDCLRTCLIIAQFLSHSVVIEQIIFSLRAWLEGMLFFTDLGCSDLVGKNACSSMGLQWYVIWMFYFCLYKALCQQMQFFKRNWII